MTLASQITSAAVSPLNLPLFMPFGISGGAHATADNVLFRVTLADGTVGYGEGAPLPPYNGETQQDALTALATAPELLAGRDARDWHGLAAEFRASGGHKSGSAQAALEMALLDAVAQQQGRSLTTLFGGATTELETDMTVTTGTAADARVAAEDIRRRGIRWIKVKVGGAHDTAHDLARIDAIREVAPEAPLILDANAGLDRGRAGELVRGLKGRGVTPALLEQWLPKADLDGMRALHLESGWLVAADESVSTAADVAKIATAGAAQVVNIKLMKAGIVAALDVVRAARQYGLELMIGGNVESILAMTTAACFAAGHGGFRFADLDTPLFLAENPFTGGYRLTGGTISVAHLHAGHGVRPA
ncbi:dipeptide epimerase [Opitutus sp. ER46]|uniref:dipeptide epimerase n=1 Tax=Opitutus sp. ER46 TaxID=2161864 RepID=UPI000D3197F7|nr:dipeptide epimerase [Opitutus sp. ER46]PTX95484.1 dipeptide epimerase [Opitutus sp. ER46]